MSKWDDVTLNLCGYQEAVWDNGHFSLCFIDTVLFGLGFVIILLLGIRKLYQLLPMMRREEAVFSKLYGTKLAISIFLVFAMIAQDVAIYFYRDPGQGTHLVYYAGFVSLSWIIALGVLHLEFTRGQKHDFVLPTWWTIEFMIGSIKLQALLDGYLADWTFWYFVGSLVLWGALAILGLFFNYDVMPEHYRLLDGESKQGETKRGDYGSILVSDGRKNNPEDSANIFSRFTFTWIQPLLSKGVSQPLQQEDLFHISREDTSDYVYAAFDKEWKDESVKEKPSLAKTLNRAFGRPFWIGGLYKLVNDALVFAGPVFLNLIIDFIEESGTEPLYVGILYAVGLLICAIVQSMAINQYYHLTYRVGMRLRSAVVTAVYNKALRLSGAARQSTTVGEVVNHMSVDAQRLQELTMNLHMIWSGPLQVFVSIGLLWNYVGVATLGGLGVMFLMIPINGMIVRKMGALQKEMMKAKDGRVKVVNEVLQGIRLIKFFAWEDSFLYKIGVARANELYWLTYSAYLRAGVFFFWLTTPLIVSLVTFAVYVGTGNELDAQTAFTALSLFNILRFPLNILPTTVAQVVEARISFDRIQKYLFSQELDPNAVQHTKNNNTPVAVSITGASFEWTENQAIPTLSNINFSVERGSLVAVVGAVGSGKSSLLAALLGDIRKKQGIVTLDGTIAYVPQQPWIQNATVKENILFGAHYDERKYDNVVSVCELKPDMRIFPAGENTEIGEKGINLSGGQKQRVSLARATYQSSDVYILDDPMSAVDAHVGKAIFNNCINGALKGKTRILVTHQLQYLRSVDKVYVMKDGQIQESGSFEDLMQRQGELYRLVTTHVKESQHKDDEHGSKKDLNDLKKSTNEGGKEEKKKDAKLMTIEERDTGAVKSTLYLEYTIACGGFFVGLLTFIGFTLDMSAQIGSNWWLSYWSDQPEGVRSVGFYLGIYGGLGGLSGIATLFKGMMLAYGSMRAAQFYHDRVLRVVMRAPSSFFDTTPIGRILNRFSKDQYTLDETLSRSMMMYLSFLFACGGILLVVAFVTPFFLTALLPLMWLYSFVQNYYLTASRELKRLDSISRSPIYAQFGETLTGVSTIRAYAAESRFTEENNRKLDDNQAAYLATIAANRWLGVRLEAVGNAVVFLSAFFSVVGQGNVNPGEAGLSLTYALSLTGLLNMLVRMYTEVETQMVSVERMEQYTHIEPEAPEITSVRPPSNWPAEGNISLQNIKLRYRAGLELVLNGISADIKSTEKIGVLGRTGAGKSSLMLALFRMVELAEGKIFIDGIDISVIGLKDLRSKLSIIPQDPTLFAGTIKSNLDPFNQYTDDSIWKALDSVSLKDAVLAMPGQLEASVSEAGDNLSVGQRQLMCLARALLKKAKILIMDEATAAVDYETDALIQKTIRSEFSYCTVLTIAHRVHTIMDYDRVMVLDKGKILEFGTPSALLTIPNGAFASMVAKSGTATSNNQNQDSVLAEVYEENEQLED